MFEGRKIIKFEDEFDEGTQQYIQIEEMIKSKLNIEKIELDAQYELSFKELNLIGIIERRVMSMQYSASVGYFQNFGEEKMKVFLIGKTKLILASEINDYENLFRDSRYHIG